MSSYENLLTDPDLLARWNGDGNNDNVGDLINIANSGTYDGTWVGTPSYFDGQNPDVKAFNCNDANYFTTSGPTLTGALTFTATINTTVTTITDQIAHFYLQSSPFPGWGVRLVDGELQFWMGDGSWRSAQSNDYNTGEYIPIAIVYNGSTVNFYKNGVPDGSVAAASSIPEFTGIKAIGATNVGTSIWGGTLEDVRIYDKALNAAQIGYIASGPTLTYESVVSSATVHCPLQDVAGSSTIDNLVGADGDWIGTAFTTVSGPITPLPSAINFVSNRIETGYFTGFGNNQHGTLAIWLDQDVRSNFRVPFSTRGGNYGFLMRIDSTGALTILLGNGSTLQSHVSGYTIPLNTWVHIAVAWDNTECQWYINGEPYGSPISSVGVRYLNYELMIGSQGDGGYTFDGQMADALFFAGTKLSSAEIAQIYLGPTATKISNIFNFYNRLRQK